MTSVRVCIAEICTRSPARPRERHRQGPKGGQRPMRSVLDLRFPLTAGQQLLSALDLARPCHGLLDQ